MSCARYFFNPSSQHPRYKALPSNNRNIPYCAMLLGKVFGGSCVAILSLASTISLHYYYFYYYSFL